MKKFLAAAAAGFAALALPCLPAAAAVRPQATVLPVNALAHPVATDQPVPPGDRRAASGVAVLMWAAATAGLTAMRCGRNLWWRRARRRPISDAELRQLVGLPLAT